MRPFLDDAESWVMDNITSEPVFSIIAAYDADNQLRAMAAKIVCMEAFRNAIPFRDLVLTPNGFGIVSNTNVAPASKELMDVFRSEVLSGAISAPHRAVITSLQSVEIVMLKSLFSTSTCSIEHNMLTNIVDVVRKDPLNFPEWHSSNVAKLFSPPIFKNKKKDTRYWF